MLTLYTTPTCAKCRDVKTFLDRHNIEFETVDLSQEPDIQQNLIETLGVMTVPITTNGEEYVIGPDYAALRRLSV